MKYIIGLTRTFFLTILVLQHFGCTAQVTVTVSADKGKTFVLPEDFYGYNAQMLRGPTWQEAGFTDRVKELKPALIRYPGGTISSYWDWKTGWLMEGIELRPEWNKITKNPITVDDLKFACDATGALPVLVLNMMTSTLEYQMEFLRKVKQSGLPVKYVELDNEIYLGDEFYVKKFPTGKDYAAAANQWIPAIRKEFPGVKIAVIGCAEKEIQNEERKKYEGRSKTWNRDVLSVVKNIDAMTFHIYAGSGMNALLKTSGSATDEKGKPAALQAAFDKPGSEELMLGIPYNRWKTTLSYDYPLLPPGVKAWITEYNLFEREGVAAGTWAHGLYALLQTMLFMEDNRTGMTCFHNLVASAQFGAIFHNSQGFEKSVKTKPTAKLDLTASGYTLSLFGRALAAGNSTTALKFDGAPDLKGLRGQPYPSLYGWMVEGSGKQLVLVNLSGNALSLDVTKIVAASASWVQYFAPVKSQVGSSADVSKTAGKGNTIKIEAYSVVLITSE